MNKSCISQELVDDITSQQHTLKQITEKFGVSKSTVYNLAAKHKVKLFNTKDCHHHIGKRFNRLVVVEIIQKLSSKGTKITTHFKCKCDCGNEKLVSRSSLIQKQTQSCGCLLKEMAGANPLPENESMFNDLYRTYLRGSLNRGYEFSLSKEEFKRLTKQNCYYCGQSPSKFRTHPKSPSRYIYNGVDRQDNTQGYTIENCVSCCERCNRAKHIMSLTDFKKWVYSVYENFVERNRQNTVHGT